MTVMSLQYPLQGKVAAVTGAASGIGFASAQAIVLFLIILVLTVLEFVILEKKVFYR